MEESSGLETFWTRHSSWTPIYDSERSTIILVTYSDSRPPYPDKAVCKSIRRTDNPRVEPDAHCLLSSVHPNVIKYYASLNTADHTAIYMEHADFGDGEALLRAMKNYDSLYDEPSLLLIMNQLSSALNAIYQSGWTHRDIKPANIFVFTNNVIKLGDFGCAKFIENHDDQSTVVGTDAFMSPLMARAAAEGVEKVKIELFKNDVYALGSCFFSFATMALLSEFGIPEDEQGSQLYEGFVRSALTKYSSGLQDLIFSMVSLNERQRPTAAKVLDSIKCLQGAISVLEVQPQTSIQCPNCRFYAPESDFITFECGDRYCSVCLSRMVVEQAPNLRHISEFHCQNCGRKINSFVITDNQRILDKQAARLVLTLIYLSIESLCPVCRKPQPMFIRGVRCKLVKPYVAKCVQCKVEFCSFCEHKGKHTRMLIPTRYCPFFDERYYR